MSFVQAHVRNAPNLFEQEKPTPQSRECVCDQVRNYLFIPAMPKHGLLNVNLNPRRVKQELMSLVFPTRRQSTDRLDVLEQYGDGLWMRIKCPWSSRLVRQLVRSVHWVATSSQENTAFKFGTKVKLLNFRISFGTTKKDLERIRVSGPLICDAAQHKVNSWYSRLQLYPELKTIETRYLKQNRPRSLSSRFSGEAVIPNRWGDIEVRHPFP